MLTPIFVALISGLSEGSFICIEQSRGEKCAPSFTSTSLPPGTAYRVEHREHVLLEVADVKQVTLAPDADVHGLLKVELPRDVTAGSVAIVHTGAVAPRWELSLGGRGSSVKVFLPEANYDVTASMPGYEQYTKQVSIKTARDARLDLGDAPPLPDLRLRVSEQGTRIAVAGAVVMSGDRQTLGVTDDVGIIAVRPDTWPDSIRVEAVGFLPAEIDFAGSTPDLLEVTLSRGAELRSKVRLPAATHARATLEELGAKGGEVVAARLLNEENSELRFPGLEAVLHRFTLEGDDHLERWATRLELHPLEIERRDVVVEPVSLRIEVVIGEQPLSNGRVELRHSSGWETTVELDEAGHWSGDLWQGGELKARVRSPEWSNPYLTSRTIEGSGVTQWKIRLPDTKVSGVVTDRLGLDPVTNALVGIALQTDAQTLNLLTRSDERGRYVLRAIPPGVATLSVSAEGFLSSAPVTVLLAEGNSPIADVALVPGFTKAFRVYESSGVAAAGGTAIAVNQISRSSARPISPAGLLELQLPSGVSTLIAAASPQSFGVFRGTYVEKDAASMGDLRLPPPIGSLAIAARDRSNNPVTGVNWAVRFNGEMLPLPILKAIGLFGSNVASDGILRISSVPAGVYEMWPVTSEAEAESVMAAPSATAAVSFSAQPGANEFTVTLSDYRR